MFLNNKKTPIRKGRGAVVPPLLEMERDQNHEAISHF